MKQARTLLALTGLAALGAMLALGTPAVADDSGSDAVPMDSGWNGPPAEPTATPSPTYTTLDSGWN